MTTPRHLIEALRTQVWGMRVRLFRVLAPHHPVSKRLAAFWLVMLFLVGALLGAGSKMIARHDMTIGYWDYRLSHSDSIIDLNALQAQHLASGGSLSLQPQETQVAPACPTTTY